jgi:hypothetical protein
LRYDHPYSESFDTLWLAHEQKSGDWHGVGKMTFIPYPNISATSKNGGYRLEITGTPGDDFFRDQSHFVYRLYRSNQPEWEWSAADEQNGNSMLDDYPHDAWVSDQGWVIVRTHEWFHAGLLVISPDGRPVLRRLHRRVLDEEPPGFLDTQPAGYMGDSSAGPFWARSAIAYFTHSGVNPIWVIRTWWGHRVIIDLERAIFLDESALDGDLASRMEIEWIEDTLATGAEMLEKEPRVVSRDSVNAAICAVMAQVITAAYHAGWLQAQSVVPFLRRIEELGAVHQTASVGRVGWATLLTNTLRQSAKLALRRIGQEPKGLPHYSFELREEFWNQKDVTIKMFPLPEQGHLRAFGQLDPGLSQTQTLYRLGAPDFIDRNYWDYDIHSGGVSRTIRIMWEDFQVEKLSSVKHITTFNEKRDSRIKEVQKLGPQWLQITIRDHYVV